MLRARCGCAASVVPAPPVRRYEQDAPGDLLHLDIKKLGRFTRPGHAVTGRGRGTHSGGGLGWDYLHVCVDDASRLAYTEILPSENRHDASAFLERALAWLARHGCMAAASREPVGLSAPRALPAAVVERQVPVDFQNSSLELIVPRAHVRHRVAPHLPAANVGRPSPLRRHRVPRRALHRDVVQLAHARVEHGVRRALLDALADVAASVARMPVVSGQQAGLDLALRKIVLPGLRGPEGRSELASEWGEYPAAASTSTPHPLRSPRPPPLQGTAASSPSSLCTGSCSRRAMAGRRRRTCGSASEPQTRKR